MTDIRQSSCLERPFLRETSHTKVGLNRANRLIQRGDCRCTSLIYKAFVLFCDRVRQKFVIRQIISRMVVHVFRSESKVERKRHRSPKRGMTVNGRFTVRSTYKQTVKRTTR